MRMIMGSLCPSTVYLLGGDFFSFFARLPIIVHEQRPPSFFNALACSSSFFSGSFERERAREKPPQLGGIIAFFAPKCLVLSH